MRINQIIITHVYILLLLAGCAGHKPIADQSEMDANADAGNVNTPEITWEKETGTPLYSDMGQHNHAISTDHPAVQRYFNQGLVLNFAYNHGVSTCISCCTKTR